MNMTLSLSKRLQMRRKPLSRRNRRSISLRRLYQALLYLQGSTRVESGGTRYKAKVQSQLSGFVAFVRPIHQQTAAPGQVWQRAQQFPPRRSIVGLSGGQGERDSTPSIRGNHMNFGAPSASGFTDGLRAVFVRAPVPSGCTLTIVLSRLTASILIRTSC
jgi:hypothetical protein